MIAKHVPMTSATKSNFAGLVRYLTAPDGKHERVGVVNATHCQTDQTEIAILEVLNIQAQNMRSAADKTYHLIVSFRAGELPDEAVLQAIEERICAGLGFSGHQRIRVVHHDTDNLHMHIAINKIHPKRYTVHEPFNAYHTLGQLCDKLENEYGLEKDNHKAARVGSENRAADMERHAHVESLLGWIKRECKDHIQGAQSWPEMHEVMREHGLTMHERANGLVITAENGVSVKASSVGREFSKAKLEQRLGTFESKAAPTTNSQAGKHYDKSPMRSRVNTVELHARYKLAQAETGSTRAGEWAKAVARKNRLIEDAKRNGRLKRAAIKLVQAPAIGKKVMYAATSTVLRDDIAAINKQYRKERQEIYEKYRRRVWADWLRSEAMTGDKEALEALRARELPTDAGGNTVGGHRRPMGTASTGPRHDSITKKGTIIYRFGASTVRDDGHKLKVSRDADQTGLQAALRMAMERYGSCLAVNGTTTFKEQIVRAAAAANLSVSFDDATLEHRRQQLTHSPTTKENKHGRKSRNDSRFVERRSDHKRHGGAAKAAASGDAARDDAAAPIKYPAPHANGDKSYARSAGPKSPPQIRNGMRGLFEFGVVHVAHGSEVLLPGHVPGHVERQGTKPNHGLRRGLRGAGRLKADSTVQSASTGSNPTSLSVAASDEAHNATRPASTGTKPRVGRTGSAPPPESQDRLRRLSQLGAVVIGVSGGDAVSTGPARPMAAPTTHTLIAPLESVQLEVETPAIAAAEKYIIEREQKKRIGFDIPKHKRFTFTDDVAAGYSGTRLIDGQALALLKVGDEVVVLPVDDATARRLKRLPLGRPVEVSATGAIKSKGRSR